VGILLASLVGFGIGYSGQRNQVSTTSLTQTTTQTITLSTSSKGSTSPPELYELGFNQTPVCNLPRMIIPWYVTLGNKTTIVEPPGDNLSECCTLTSYNRSYTPIIFSLPNGVYNFSVFPNELYPRNGTIMIDGKDENIELTISIASCGSATTSR
jgi:hypothetical protein